MDISNYPRGLEGWIIRHTSFTSGEAADFVRHLSLAQVDQVTALLEAAYEAGVTDTSEYDEDPGVAA
jgi:hypothetical protein